MELKFVTFNIRGDFGVDGKNEFEYRKPLILEKILAQKPDVVGFQEVSDKQRTWLDSALEGYTVLGCGRGAHFDSESMSIAVRKQTMEVIALDTFWLSETPYKPGTRFAEQSENPRICTHMILLPRGSKKPLHLYNTHLDHISDKARLIGLSMVLQRIEQDGERRPYPIVLLGDFNAEPDSMEMTEMERCPWLTDHTGAVPMTYHGFGLEAPQKIDYIFTSEEFTEPVCTVWDDVRDGVYLSDHYPLCVSLQLDA